MVSAKKVCSLLRVLNLHIIRNHVIETILTHAFVNFNQPNQEGVGAGGGGGSVHSTSWKYSKSFP